MYVKANYPQFSDIKLWHRHGWNSELIFKELGQFINDPANADLRYIDSFIHYLDGAKIANLSTCQCIDPNQNTWVEVAVLYTEN